MKNNNKKATVTSEVPTVPKSPGGQRCSFQNDRFSALASTHWVSCFCTTQAKPGSAPWSEHNWPCCWQLLLCWMSPVPATPQQPQPHQHGAHSIPSLAAEWGHMAKCPAPLTDRQVSSILQHNEGSEANEKSSKSM